MDLLPPLEALLLHVERSFVQVLELIAAAWRDLSGVELRLGRRLRPSLLRYTYEWFELRHVGELLGIRLEFERLAHPLLELKFVHVEELKHF